MQKMSKGSFWISDQICTYNWISIKTQIYQTSQCSFSKDFTTLWWAKNSQKKPKTKEFLTWIWHFNNTIFFDSRLQLIALDDRPDLKAHIKVS